MASGPRFQKCALVHTILQLHASAAYDAAMRSHRGLGLSLMICLACAGSNDGDDGAASFGGSQPTPTMPTMVTSASASLGGSDEAGDTGASEDDPTSGDPTNDPSDDPGEPAPVCGNGLVEKDEACDGENLKNRECVDFGFDMGTLACDAGCQFDTSLCSIPGCGDGVLITGEECDCGEQPGACTPEGLNNSACTDLDSPKGTRYTGGTLACNSPIACNFNKDDCFYCGDAKINGADECDTGALGGATCVSLGYKAGVLACNPDCTLDATDCTNVVCGDGECIMPVEDSCSCPEDCPDLDPNSCSPCECGGPGINCGCDVACLLFNDCCANGPC